MARKKKLEGKSTRDFAAELEIKPNTLISYIARGRIAAPPRGSDGYVWTMAAQKRTIKALKR